MLPGRVDEVCETTHMRATYLIPAGAVAAATVWRILRRRRLILTAQAAESIEVLSQDILDKLRRYKPVTVEGMDPSLHYLAPHIPKAEWTALGDLVAAREKAAAGRVDGSQWISLRLDGCGFSKAVKILRAKGILEPGFSDTFARCMVGALRALLEHFHGCVGYTQSDEMVVFIPPTNVVRGERQPHSRSGRVTKTTTLAASLVTAHFLMELSQLCVERDVGLDGLSQVLPHFDCRLAAWGSWQEARALLLWRAYDCSVNGVSDAVYHTPGGHGKSAVQRLGKREKVAWLHEQGLLPLPRHQAYGTVLARVRRQIEGRNPKTGEVTTALRGVVEQVDAPVLEIARADALVAMDERLPRFT